MIRVGNDDFDNINDWIAVSGKDVNSVSLDPKYTSSSDLHINNPFLFSIGNPEAAGARDIDDEVRTTPVTMGADEVNATLDAGVTKMLSPTFPVEVDKPYILTLELTNFGVEKIDSILVGFSINDEVQNVFKLNNVSLYVNSSIDIQIAQIQFDECDTYFLEAWTELPNLEEDKFPLNDTLKVAIQPCATTCTANISNIILKDKIKACSNGNIDIKVEDVEQDSNEDLKTTFVLVKNGFILDHNEDGIFNDYPVGNNYCVVGVRYLVEDGLSFGNGYINNIQNDFGFSSTQGACIFVSECVPVNVEILFEPSIEDFNVFCNGTTQFNATVVIDSIDNETVFGGSAFALAESYEVEGNVLHLYNLPIVEEYLDFNISSGIDSNCGGDNVLLQIPDCNIKNDASLISLVKPLNFAQPGLQTVKVVVTNLGEDGLSSLKLNWSVDGEMQPTYTFNSSPAMQQNAQDTITIGTYDFEELVCYDMTLWSTLPNGVDDENIYNDTINIEICIAMVGVDAIVINPVNIKTLSPNPAAEYLDVAFTSEQASEMQIEIFDISGKLLLNQQVNALAGENTHRLNVENFAAGLYLLRINNGTEVQAKRFVKE